LGFPVQIYDCPLVSFIMRYSSKGELGFIRTADSIEGLKAIDWELCVSGVPSPLVKYGFPYVRWDATPAGKTTVFLEAGEIVTEKEWADIVKGAEFPI
jgi:hypothetical protein